MFCNTKKCCSTTKLHSFIKYLFLCIYINFCKNYYYILIIYILDALTSPNSFNYLYNETVNAEVKQSPAPTVSTIL